MPRALLGDEWHPLIPSPLGEEIFFERFWKLRPLVGELHLPGTASETLDSTIKTESNLVEALSSEDQHCRRRRPRGQSDKLANSPK
jgi:hypothetical protein